MCRTINLRLVLTLLVFDGFFAEAAATRYLVTASKGHVLSIPIDEKSNSKLITQNSTSLRCPNLNPSSISVGRKQLYAANINTRNIEIYSFDPERESGIDSCTPFILNSGVPGPNVKIAFDWISNNLYWTDPTFRWIAMISVQHEDNYTILIRENIHIPSAIVVDPINKYLFWSDEGKFPKIERSSLIGKDRNIIVSEDIFYPRSITVDIDNRKIYWMDYYALSVFQSDYEGKSRKTIYPFSSMMFGEIKQFSDILLVATTNQKDSLKVLTLDTYTHSPFPVIEVNTTGTSSIAILDTQIALHAINQTCEHIFVREKKQTICLCGEGFVLNSDGQTCASQAKFSADTTVPHPAIFWSTKTSICAADIRAMYDSTGNFRNRTICFDKIGWNIQWFAVDSSDMKLVYTDGTKINTLTMDGQSTRRSLVEESEEINGIAHDWIDKNVYWCQGKHNGKISFVSQSTLSRYTVITGLVRPRSLALVMSRSEMVWIEGENDTITIMTAHITGSHVRELVPFKPYALSVDELTSRIYFAMKYSLTSIDFDKQNMAIVINPIRDCTPFSVYENHVIIAYSSALSWFTLSEVFNYHTTFLNIGEVTSLAIYDNRGHLRMIDACKVNNGECDGMCIPIGRNRVCRCGYGFSMDANGRTCSSEPLLDNFIVVLELHRYTLENKIFQISLANINASAFVVPTNIVDSIQHVVYDAVKKRIIWTDGESFWYKQISPLPKIGQFGIYTDRFIDTFDMDYSTGNIYYAYKVNAKQSIGVMSPDGLNRTLIQLGTDIVGEIALDPASGSLPIVSMTRSIKRMNMDGTTKITLVSHNANENNMCLTCSNRLTIDKMSKTIYALYSGSIYRCEYEPNTCVWFYTVGGWVEDLIVVGEYLYYSHRDQFYLTKHHKQNKLEISHIAANPDRISFGIFADIISNDGPTTKCSSNNGRGECSTFCHPIPNGYTCGCQDGDQLMTDNKTCKLAFVDSSAGPRPSDNKTVESDEYTFTVASFTSKAYPAFKTEVSDTGSSSKLLYIVASVGAVIAILVAAISIVIIYKKRRANVQLHFGARYVQREPTGDPANVVNTSTHNIVDSNINLAIIDPILDQNRDVDIPLVPVNPYLELEDGDTYDCISEGGLQLNRALPPLPDDTRRPLRGSVDEGDVEEEKEGYCIGRVGRCTEEYDDDTE
ncbi:low-density lipoprotein receptor-related protein 6-like isoform X3 [Dreissena polymorpha]|uniref:low-density lipoprotein receptor-related protein 6-like isoform X3 n=1 Tax=Dreissena polymorpha TaxID=45954 RepID=UPI0022651DCF|nr:low-density lipoprotein receptor-related protein 6-like isoform X3 [Dreissena polymorpha]